MKGIIYVRVSSAEQIQGTSLKDQEERCLKYCNEKNIKVLKIFKEEGESAKTTQRTKFMEAIEFCRKNKNSVDAFVVFKLDRFARNIQDHFGVRKVLFDYGTTLFSVCEPIDNSPSGKLFETMLAGFAEFDNDVRKQRSVNGMLSKIKQGLYPWHPPVGYVPYGARKKDGKLMEPHPIDPKIFPVIQKGLKLFSTGMYTYTDLRKYWKNSGLDKLRGKNTTVGFVHQVLDDRHVKYYAGILINPWPESDDDIEIEGKHQPMISKEELFNIIQIKLGKNPARVKKDRYNPMFPLRRLVKCSTCKGLLTGSSPRGKGGVYHYYHCPNKKCSRYSKSIKKYDLEKDFSDLLLNIVPKKHYIDKIKERLECKVKNESSLYENDIDKLKNKIEKLNKKKSRVNKMREDGEYSKDEYLKRKEEINNEILASQISLNESQIETFDIKYALDYAVKFIANLSEQWEKLSPQQKPLFQKLIFPDGVEYDPKKGVGTPKLGELFEYSNKKRKNVRPAGLEPATVRLRGDCSTG